MQVFDDYLQQLGEDTAAYVRTVCQTIVLTVPKAVIHCQVRFRILCMILLKVSHAKRSQQGQELIAAPCRLACLFLPPQVATSVGSAAICAALTARGCCLPGSA